MQSNQEMLQNGLNYVLRPNYQKAKIKNLREQSPFQNGKRNRDFVNPSLTSNMIFYNQKGSTISNPHMVRKPHQPRGYDLNNYVVTDIEAIKEKRNIPVSNNGSSKYSKSRINLKKTKKTLKRNVSSSQRSLHRSRSKNSINNVSARKINVVKKSQRSISRNRSMKRNKSDNNIGYSNSKIENDLISKKSKKSGASKRSKKSNLNKAKERLLKKKKNNQNEINDLIKLNKQNDRTRYEEYLGKSNNKKNNLKAEDNRENSRYSNNDNSRYQRYAKDGHSYHIHENGHSYHYHDDGHLKSHDEGHSQIYHEEEGYSQKNGFDKTNGHINTQKGFTQEKYSQKNGHYENDGHNHYQGNSQHDHVHNENCSHIEELSQRNNEKMDRISRKSGNKNVSRGCNSDFTGVSGSNVSDPNNLICDKCINNKIHEDKLMNLEQQRMMDEEFANKVNENLRRQLQREREENILKKNIYNEAINNQIEDLKTKKRQRKQEQEDEDRKIRDAWENNQSELDQIAEERRKKNNFIKDLKNQINKKREIEFLKREEEFQIDQETPNVLIDDGFRRDQREAMKEYYKNNLINQMVEKEKEKDDLKRQKLNEDEEYRIELDRIKREERQKRLELEQQKKKLFMNEINKQLKDNEIKKAYQNELNRRGDEDYWKKIDNDQKVYMENMFRKKENMNGYIQNLGEQIDRDNERKQRSLYERKKKTNTTLCMGKKPTKCYNCAICRAKYPLKMLNKKKRYNKK